MNYRSKPRNNFPDNNKTSPEGSAVAWSSDPEDVERESMITPEDIETRLKMLSGSEGQLPLIRDSASDTGVRVWSREDSVALCQWLVSVTEHMANKAQDLACYNQKEVAELLGFSVAKIREWMDREQDPMPHIKEGRLTRVVHFLLMEWLREESLRCAGAKEDDYERRQAAYR